MMPNRKVLDLHRGALNRVWRNINNHLSLFHFRVLKTRLPHRFSEITYFYLDFHRHGLGSLKIFCFICCPLDTLCRIVQITLKMPLPYIDTPRTEVDGNATYLTTGLRSATRANLSALDSVENSLQIPSKDDDILKTFEKRRRSSSGFILGTPRAGSGPGSVRNALDDRRNVAPPKGEFTPMMRSVTRNNYTRNMSAARGTGVPRTPAFLKEGYHGNTPGLPLMDLTDINEKSITGSIEDEQATPVPQVASSSAQSTPLPILPRRDGSGGILSDGQNMMSLKEQERVSITFNCFISLLCFFVYFFFFFFFSYEDGLTKRA
jgi:hypothetical protein